MEKLENQQKYPTKISGEHDIDNMSVSFLKTQIECVSHTGRNLEYLEKLKEAYRRKTMLIFKPLLDGTE